MRSKSSCASRSRYCFSDCRQKSPRLWPSRSWRSSWKGPAFTTTTYVDSRGVSGKLQRRPPSPASSTPDGALLLVTVHDSGASTVNACGAFRSGWSKQAQARRASSGSNDVQT